MAVYWSTLNKLHQCLKLYSIHSFIHSSSNVWHLSGGAKTDPTSHQARAGVPPITGRNHNHQPMTQSHIKITNIHTLLTLEVTKSLSWKMLYHVRRTWRKTPYHRVEAKIWNVVMRRSKTLKRFPLLSILQNGITTKILQKPTEKEFQLNNESHCLGVRHRTPVNKSIQLLCLYTGRIPFKQPNQVGTVAWRQRGCKIYPVWKDACVCVCWGGWRCCRL